MHTATHFLIGAQSLARKGERGRNIAVVVGTIFPDVTIFVMFWWATLFLGLPQRTIWDEVYFQDGWHTAINATNSLPIFVLIIVIGLLIRQAWIWGFGAAALLHVAFDLPFHHNDGHAHFWPITDWIFESPISYWDPAHFGVWVTSLEMVIAVVLVTVLWRRFHSPWWRGLLIVAAMSYSVLIFFALTLGPGSA